ncbi:MAG: hypothetical protein O4859_03435 [Trichodesmium sp. St18_bin1]|nr:hypothetical protein [Trichodesmium sp. St18_bin1]MDE5123978.1 hypothetical protein [Trichodesmium sp. St19_bin1]
MLGNRKNAIFSLTFLSLTLINFSGFSKKNGVGFRKLYPTYGIFSLTPKPEDLKLRDRLI